MLALVVFCIVARELSQSLELELTTEANNNSSRLPTSMMIRLSLWGLPLIFASGIFYATATSTSESVDAVQKSARATENRVRDHERSGSHPVTNEKLVSIKNNIENIEIEQRGIITEQRRMGENISAICQATGATCR